jgi:hypothetical protein
VFDFGGPARTMRLVSVHPGVTVDEVQAATAFPVHIDGEVPTTRLPSQAEREVLERIDPRNLRGKELPE